jgi:2-(1,2-epoxy-1,2-dihydrophenyl)acetyl-CoA isomerase
MHLAGLGVPLDAATCEAWGLATEVHAPEVFGDEWRNFAARLAVGPTRAYALIKSLLDGAAVRSLDQHLEAEVSAQTEAGQTTDHLEGVRAFLEKRPPGFVGS